MKIKINDIPEEGLDLEFSENLAELNVEHEQLEKLKEVTANIHIQKEDFGFFAFGEINVDWDLICNRCLIPFPQTAKIEFSREYRLIEEDIADEKIEEDILSAVLIKNEEIDLENEIKEDLLLAIPIKILCKAECKGICPNCGQNLNVKKCSCVQEETDIRWEALKEIKNKLEKTKQNKTKKIN
ncbi:MAG: DUF177 domain-containing protein [bacterium]|nr:DUF177 domain-containing protein [bacterium]